MKTVYSMVGIVYKFTIIAKYKMNGRHPFYIGQHWCKSKEDFLNRDYPYYGSGSIWNDFLSKIKQEYSTKWRYFIRREILCCVNNRDSQSTLNKLEEYWIKRENAHYSLGLGGCNVIIGAAIEVSPTLDPIVANKISKKKRDFYKTERGLEIRKKLSEIRIGNEDWAKKVSIGLRKSDNFHNAVRSEEHRKKMSEIAKKRLSISENHPMFGKHHLEESKRILREKNLGKSLSDETKRKISIANTGERHWNYGNRYSEEMKKKLSNAHKGKKFSEETKMKMRISQINRRLRENSFINGNNS